MDYVNNLEALVTELKKKNDVLTKKLKEKGGSGKELTVELAKVRTENSELTKQYNLLVEQFKMVDKERTDLKVTCDETILNAKKRISALQKQLAEAGNINEVRKEKDSQIIILNNKIEDLVDENTRLRVESKEEEVEELTKEIQNLNSQLKLYKEEHTKYAELLKEKIELETQLKVVKAEKPSDDIIALKAENEELRKQLEEQKQKDNERYRLIQQDLRQLQNEYEEKLKALQNS